MSTIKPVGDVLVEVIKQGARQMVDHMRTENSKTNSNGPYRVTEVDYETLYIKLIQTAFSQACSCRPRGDQHQRKCRLVEAPVAREGGRRARRREK